LISAITLAGAAEEILGKLCEKQGKTSSLLRHAESARSLHRHLASRFPDLFGPDPGTRPFVDFRNKTRNELKHLMSGGPVDVDLREKAARLIAHAVENYRALSGRETPKMRQFQRRRLGLEPQG